MKQAFKIIGTLAYLLIGTLAFAQAPQKFNYQGIARDLKGNPMSKQQMSLKLTVLPTADATVAEYEETQMVTTNEFGLYTLQIGNGTAITGDMKSVKWETGNKYIKVAIDPKGGSNYVDAGTSQLLSVPYALYADKAGNSNSESRETRLGAVSTSAAGTGTVNFLTKFTAANTIFNSQIFDNGAQVGIGTTTPLASGRLHIVSASGTQPLILESPQGVHNLVRENGVNRGYFGSFIGSGAAQGYPTPAGTSNEDFDIGTSGASTGKLHLATNTTPRVTIMPTTGDMGIGTTTPTAKLEVAGQVKITGGAPGAGKVLTSDATGLATWQTPALGTAWSLTGNAGTNPATNYIGTTDGQSLNFRIGSEKAGRLTSSGSSNISLGANTTNFPNGGLDNAIFGTNTATSTSFSGSQNTLIGNEAGRNLTTGNGNTYVGEDAGTGDTTGFHNVALGEDAGGNIRSGSHNTLIGMGSNINTGNLTYATAIGSEAIVSSSNSIVLGRTNDKVGIGTSSPTAKLDVQGAGGGLISLTSSNANNWMTFNNSSGYTGYIGNFNSATALDFGTSGVGTDVNLVTGSVPRLVVKSTTGNVGIGTSIANRKLTVAGDGDFSGGVFLGSIEYIADSGANTIGTNSNLVPDATASRNLGSSSKRWNNIFLVNSPNVSSDARLKDNVTNLNYGLATVLKLRPVSYNLNIGDDKGLRLGLIAQELQKVVPEIVNDKEYVRDENDKVEVKKVDYLTVRYEELIPVLIKGMQEQQKMIEELKSEIQSLKENK